MKDKEYTDLSDLVRLDTVVSILGEIVPKTSDVINVQELGGVLDQLRDWRDELRRNITIMDDEDPLLTFKGSNKKQWDPMA